jgi:hypothetical protein
MYLKEISGAIPVQIYWMSRICCIYWTTNQLKPDSITITGGGIWIYYPHLYVLDNLDEDGIMLMETFGVLWIKMLRVQPPSATLVNKEKPPKNGGFFVYMGVSFFTRRHILLLRCNSGAVPLLQE